MSDLTLQEIREHISKELRTALEKQTAATGRLEDYWAGQASGLSLALACFPVKS